MCYEKKIVETKVDLLISALNANTDALNAVRQPIVTIRSKSVELSAEPQVLQQQILE